MIFIECQQTCAAQTKAKDFTIMLNNITSGNSISLKSQRLKIKKEPLTSPRRRNAPYIPPNKVENIAYHIWVSMK